MFEEYLDVGPVYNYVSFVSLAFLLEALVLMWIGKFIRDRVASFDVNEELTEKDNKAVAVSYAGYMVAQAIIIIGVLEGPSTDVVTDLINVAIWSLAGIIFLNIAQFCNDRLLLREFNNTKELIQDRNVGTGAVICGSYIGTAFLVRAVVVGDGTGGDLTDNLIGASIFFIVGQIGFILFSYVYQNMAKFDLHGEIERDNVAAGLGFGMTLIAVGIVMSNTVEETRSLPAFGVWFLTGIVLLVLTRILVDKLILPGSKLDHEISEDRNWGAALIEGSAAVMVAFVLNITFTAPVFYAG